METSHTDMHEGAADRVEKVLARIGKERNEWVLSRRSAGAGGLLERRRTRAI